MSLDIAALLKQFTCCVLRISQTNAVTLTLSVYIPSIWLALSAHVGCRPTVRTRSTPLNAEEDG
jgi:hypothetical protein